MNWLQLISNVRFGQEYATAAHHDARSEFKRDSDRLIYSPPFRRLQNKTQVFPLPGSVFVHNRLTHSLEVASLGMSLGSDVARILIERHPELKDTNFEEISTIVHAACLAHDMGNPPFGHSGEKAIQAFFTEGEGSLLKDRLSKPFWEDITHFEGNANAFRLLTHQFNGRRKGGFVLTYSMLASIVKYPFSSHYAGRHGKFGFFQSESADFQKIADELGMIRLSFEGEPLRYVRHPLVYLVEAADDICYALLDLEDAVDLELLSDTEVESVLSGLTFVEPTWHAQSSRQRCAMLRGIAIGRAIDDVAQTFMKHQSDLLNGEFKGKDLLALCSPEVQDTLENAKELAKTRIFRHQSKLMTEIASFPCLGSILDLLVPAAHQLLTEGHSGVRQSLVLELLKNEHPISREDSLYHAYMKILDFVGGMTDNAAAKMARELSGIGMI